MKTYTGELTVSTPIGDERSPFTVTMEEKAIDADVRAELIVFGKDFEGKGCDLEWGDAFAELQKSLPEGYALKCCLTCRHGNTWIYGNVPNLVFCTHGETIRDKDDLIDFFCGTKSESAARKATDVCEKFAPQSEDCFTYNNYGYYLKGKNDG